MRVWSLQFPIPILVLLLLSGAGCRQPMPSGDVTCNRTALDSASRGWNVYARTGTTTDSALYARERGQLVIRSFARSDSTPIADTLTAGLTAGPNPSVSFHEGPNGTVTIEKPAGFYVVATKCPRCARSTWPHTVVAGRVDTLDLYLGRTQSQCDAATTSRGSR
jgi:hypothetical protein